MKCMEIEYTCPGCDRVVVVVSDVKHPAPRCWDCKVKMEQKIKKGDIYD